MENKERYILLNNLEVYRLARELSQKGWSIYNNLDWQTKKIVGDQFIEVIDSVGANIAEGYNRFHYLDKIRFYYNARASLSEGNDHWLDILREREKVEENFYEEFKNIAEKLSMKLNAFIKSTYRSKQNHDSQ